MQWGHLGLHQQNNWHRSEYPYAGKLGPGKNRAKCHTSHYLPGLTHPLPAMFHPSCLYCLVGTGYSGAGTAQAFVLLPQALQCLRLRACFQQ